MPESTYLSAQPPQLLSIVLKLIKQDGLEWASKLFGLEPHRISEPDIATVTSIARKHLNLQETAFCQVTFHAEGAFNKLYKVETRDGCFLLHVTLPVDPSNKTISEVATIGFLRQATDMPLPQILAFDDSSENELKYEWMLMDLLPGGNLHAKWRKLSDDSKRSLVKQIVQYQVQLFRHKFSAIGNIFVGPGSRGISKDPHDSMMLTDTEGALRDSQVTLPALGQIVSMIFFWGDHITQDVPRGPFTNSEDCIRARLALILTDQERILTTSEDEDAQTVKDLAERLSNLLPSFFPPNANATEQFVLCHDDLSMHNILIDDDGNITGIVDWECIPTLPLWSACQFPEFLKEETEMKSRAEINTAHTIPK